MALCVCVCVYDYCFTAHTKNYDTMKMMRSNIKKLKQDMLKFCANERN